MWRNLYDQAVHSWGGAIASEHHNDIANAPELIAVGIENWRSCQAPHERTCRQASHTGRLPGLRLPLRAQKALSGLR